MDAEINDSSIQFTRPITPLGPPQCRVGGKLQIARELLRTGTMAGVAAGRGHVYNNPSSLGISQ